MKAITPTSTITSAMPVRIRITVNIVSIGPANVDPASGSHQRIELSSRFSARRR
jgi:hypothetical protein